MATTRRRAAIYTRLSRDKDGDGVGVARQEALCRKKAESLGLEVVEVYSDNDIGASNRTGNKPRKDYQRMLADVRSGSIDTIIAYSNSRLTRRPAEWIELIALAESGALQIETEASGKYDLTTAEGRALAITVAAWDAAEADRISERQRVTFLDNAMAGKPKLQRQRPFGWKEDGITLEPAEADLIRQAVAKLKAGATVTTIAREWESAGVPTAAGRVKWEHSVLKRVLTGWRTAGVRTYRREPLRNESGQLVMGTWEPIISLEDREQALAMLQKHARIKKRQGSWPLSGFVHCGECTRPLYGQTPSGRRNRAMYGCKAGHVSISAGLLEELILSKLANRLYRRGFEGRELERAKPKSGPDWPGHERLNQVRTKIQELMDAYNGDVLDGDTVFPQVRKLRDEAKTLERELSDFLADEAVPNSPMMRTSEALEWVQDLMSTFQRDTPRKGAGSRGNAEDRFEAAPGLSDEEEVESRIVV